MHLQRTHSSVCRLINNRTAFATLAAHSSRPLVASAAASRRIPRASVSPITVAASTRTFFASCSLRLFSNMAAPASQAQVAPENKFDLIGA
jgi:hypothetical protein